MDISRGTLIGTMIVNILMLVASVVCMVLLDFSVVSLGLFTAIAVLILISSIIIWHCGKAYKK